MLKKILVAGVLTASVASAAPLFPDVPDNHWARDAVAALAAKGLVEGYPDGTFKGDRAASRWEVAMVVARLLAKMEQEHATFATKAELEELRKLVDALRDELEALGVRVQNLEENVARIDKRVADLERITFSGEINTTFGAMRFYNTGSSGQFAPNGAPVALYQPGTAEMAGGLLSPPNIAAGQSFLTNQFGVLTATDWEKGVPQPSGNVFTSLARLNVNARITDDVDAGALFYAYAMQGDLVADNYYGQSFPYLSNAVAPVTQMTLDNAWVHHKPSDTRLVMGSFKETDYDPSVFLLTTFPAGYLNGYGLQVRGKVGLGDDASAYGRYEAITTRFLDTSGYFTHGEGGNISLHFHDDRGVARLNFLHTGQDSLGGAALAVGFSPLVANPNLNWVNPKGFFTNQIPGVAGTAGVGSVTDVRPVPSTLPGSDGMTGVPNTFNLGAFGPQDQTTYGLSARYEFEDEAKPFVMAEYAHSEYKPQKNSTFNVGGNAFRIGAGADLFEGDLALRLYYLNVDARFDPLVLGLPSVGVTPVYYRLPGSAVFPGVGFNFYDSLYSVHDASQFPNNREGIRAALSWEFLDQGMLSGEYGRLNQKTSSLQDVRFSANSLAPGTPNQTVLGYSPGFIEPVFGAFSIFTFAPSGTNLVAVPLENNKGVMTNWGVSAGYKFLFDPDNQDDQRGVGLNLGVKDYNFFRNSNLATIRAGSALGIRGENENFMDLTYRGWRGMVDYDACSNFVVHAGYNQVDIFGHSDPYGVYSNYAVATRQTRFNNLDMTQSWPELGFDWGITDNTSVNVTGKYFFVRDHIAPGVFATPVVPSQNLNFGPTVGAHPFNYEGWQLLSTFSYKF